MDNVKSSYGIPTDESYKSLAMKGSVDVDNSPDEVAKGKDVFAENTIASDLPNVDPKIKTMRNQLNEPHVTSPKESIPSRFS